MGSRVQHATVLRRIVTALAVRLGLCTALGAATSVAVAWSLAILVNISTAREQHLHQRFQDNWITGNTKGWNITWRSTPGATRVRVEPGAWGPTPRPPRYARVVGAAPGLRRELESFRVMEAAREERLGQYAADCRGWPWPALGCAWPWHDARASAPPDVSWGIALEPYATTIAPLPAVPPLADEMTMLRARLAGTTPPVTALNSADQLRALPLRPAWPGLALCAAFYGALWGLLLFAPFLLSLLARQYRGVCLVCGYDTRGLTSAACPECGSKRAATGASPPVSRA